jgi:hypothetical protein
MEAKIKIDSDSEAQKVRQILETMPLTERQSLINEIYEMEINSVSQITETMEGIKKRFNVLSTDNWEIFCEELNSICRDIRSMWRLIESFNQEQKVKQIKTEIKKMVKQGFKFSQIRIDGIDFCIRDGEINPSDDDQIPF